MISRSKLVDKQKDILAAALKLFTEYGFHGTPTSKIAQEAGVANGTLFHYYKTKDELIIALYADIKTKLSFCIDIKPNGQESIKDIARRNYISAINWSLENPAEFRFTQQFMTSPYMALVPPQIQEQSSALLDLVKEGIRAKEIKVTPPEYVAELLNSHLSAVHQYLTRAKLSQARQKQVIADSFELLWKMLS